MTYKESWLRWQNLYNFGGADPFWEDGANLNLCRNHMIYALNNGEVEPPEMPLPPEVDPSYMARADEIRANARAALARLEANPDFDRLESMPRPKGLEPQIRNVLNFRSGLRKLIEDDDLVSMRRYENADRYMDAPVQMIARIQAEDLSGQQMTMEEFL